MRQQIKQTIEQADGQAKIAEKRDGDDSTGHSIAFEDVPKKIVLKQKSNAKGDEAFKFMTELSVPAYCSTVDNP